VTNGNATASIHSFSDSPTNFFLQVHVFLQLAIHDRQVPLYLRGWVS
jgi:hypothetical protein